MAGGRTYDYGAELFKKVIEYQKKYAPPGAVINNGLQTNGTLIDQTMAEFNILCLINSENVGKPEELYKYFREKGFHFLQFIPAWCILIHPNLFYYKIIKKIALYANSLVSYNNL